MSRARGDFGEAGKVLGEALDLAGDLNEMHLLAEVLEAHAALAAAQGQPERALRLAGSATALREAIHVPLTPADRARWEAAISSAGDLLGQTTAETALAAGRLLTADEAVQLARST